MSLSCIVNWVCNFLVGLMFPYMQAVLGNYSFVPFGCVLLMTCIFAYSYLPETHGRSVAEIQRLVAEEVDTGNERYQYEQSDSIIERIEGVEDHDLGEEGYEDDTDEIVNNRENKK